MRLIRWIGQKLAQAMTWWPHRGFIMKRTRDAFQQIGVTLTGAGVIGLFVDEDLALLAIAPIVMGAVALYFGITQPKEMS